jgi:predicted AAA+ superfamily ATPase
MAHFLFKRDWRIPSKVSFIGAIRPCSRSSSDSASIRRSSELSTLLSGRYVEIKMQPLSFKEYLDFIESDKESSLGEKFNQYIQYGGLPTVVELLDNPDTIGPFLEGIYNTVLMKDVIEFF